MGRAEPTRDEAEVRFEPFPKGRLELGWIVADDRDARRLDAEPQQFLRQERPVQIGAVAADELAAGHDDEAAGAAQAAGVIPRGVTM